MNTTRVGRRHTFYRAHDLLTSTYSSFAVSYFLSQLGPRFARMLKFPMYSEGHILSAPGLLATFFEGLLIRRALPLSDSSGDFSFIVHNYLFLSVFVI